MGMVQATCQLGSQRADHFRPWTLTPAVPRDRLAVQRFTSRGQGSLNAVEQHLPRPVATGVLRTTSTTPCSVPPDTYCIYSSRSFLSARTRCRRRGRSLHDRAGPALRFIAPIADTFRPRTAASTSAGQKHAGKSSLPEQQQQIKIIDLVSGLHLSQIDLGGRIQRGRLVRSMQAKQSPQFIGPVWKTFQVFIGRWLFSGLRADVVLFVDEICGQGRTQLRVIGDIFLQRRGTLRCSQRYSKSTLISSTSVMCRSDGGSAGRKL